MKKRALSYFIVFTLLGIFFSQAIHAQVGNICHSDTDCVGLGVSLKCLPDPQLPAEKVCTITQAGGGTTAPVIGCRNGTDCVSLINPLATTENPNPSIQVIIGNTIRIIMGIVGSITLVVFLYGGFLWLTSAGNSEKISKGMQAMLWATIGIIVVFSSYAILSLILSGLGAVDSTPPVSAPITNTAGGNEPTICHCNVSLTGTCSVTSVMDISLGQSYGITDLKTAIANSALNFVCKTAANVALDGIRPPPAPVVLTKDSCARAGTSGTWGTQAYQISCQLK